MQGRRPHPRALGPLRRCTSLLALTLLAALVTTTSAQADTTVRKNTSGGVTTLTITAGSGEEHDIWVGWNEDDQNYEITDDSSPIHDNIGCAYVAADEQVVCPKGSPQVSVVVVTTANLDDAVMLDLEGGERSTITTGAGDDIVQGLAGRDDISTGPNDDIVDGAEGSDVVDGGDGDDMVDGGDGDDWLSGQGGNDEIAGEDGADTIYGGAGIDAVDYTGARSGVKVDLDGNADDGAVGEHDSVKPDIEDIRGGSGNDTLTGNDQANTIVGGTGNDTINARDKSADTIFCGRGADTVTADPRDKTDVFCEKVERAEPSGSSPFRSFRIGIVGCKGKAKAGTACVQIRCVGVAVSCAGSVSLQATVPRKRRKAIKATIGSNSFRTTAAKTATVKVKLSKQGARMLRRKGKLAATALVKARDEGGHAESDIGTIRLKAAKHRR